MRILWITNTLLPPIAQAVDLQADSGGGWMYASLKRLLKNSDLKFAIATVYAGREFVKKEIEGTTYYLLPAKYSDPSKYDQSLELWWQKINSAFQPEIIHIHGTEYLYGLTWVNACGARGVLVSLQGIISAIAEYYLSGLPRLTPSLRDVLRQDSLRQQQAKFRKRGEHEISLLSQVSHIAGRTEWDKAHAWAINPDAKYHYCGETLREPFYSHKWDYNACTPHSIFLSSASYPIKGFHKFLDCLPLVLRHYPDTKVRIAGDDITAKPWIRRSAYDNYIGCKIREKELVGVINFTGSLSAEAMCQEFLGCNAFVLCSSIENSPNSLGEAQMLGVPYVASFVGGVPEITGMNPQTLYRFEETEMLAKKLCDIFALKERYQVADFDHSRYDGERNSSLLTEIYNQIIEEGI